MSASHASGNCALFAGGCRLGKRRERFLKPDGASKEMAVRVARALSAKPEAGPYVATAMPEYVQVRCLYDRTGYWEPRLAGLAAPSF